MLKALRKLLGGFDHDTAQVYEFAENRRWVEQHGRDVVGAIIAERDKDPPRISPLQVEEFFGGDPAIAAEFVSDMAGKVILEVGGGPAPLTTILTRRVAALHLVDPLIDRYDAFIHEAFGTSWRAPNVTLWARNAEERIAGLVGRVNGAIVCRNCLDHAERPEEILDNFSAYAAPGCALLLWTDLFHLDGADEGHHNITRDVDGFARGIERRGFRIDRRVPEKEGRGMISYGCFAVRS